MRNWKMADLTGTGLEEKDLEKRFEFLSGM